MDKMACGDYMMAMLKDITVQGARFGFCNIFTLSVLRTI